MDINGFVPVLPIATNLFYMWILNLFADKTLGPHRFEKTKEYCFMYAWLIVYVRLCNRNYLLFADKTIVSLLWHMLYASIFYKSSLRRNMAFAVYFLLSNMLSEAYAYICLEKIGKFNYSIYEFPEKTIVLGSALAKLFLLMFVYIFMLTGINIQKKASINIDRISTGIVSGSLRGLGTGKIEPEERVYMGNLIIPGASCCMLINMSAEINDIDTWSGMIAGLFLINMVSYNQYIVNVINMVKNYIYDADKEKLAVYKTLVEHLYDVQEKLRGFRHDTKKQNMLERLYLEQGELDKLRGEYDRKNAIVDMSIKITGNPIIDAVVISAKKQAGQKGISFEDDIRVPADVHFNDDDINGLLGNILENAVNGAASVKNAGKVCCPFIKLTVRYEMGNVYIECENSCNDDKGIKAYNAARMSMKRNINIMKRRLEMAVGEDNSHGMGVFIITRIVDFYNGLLEVAVNENEAGKSFILKILMYDVTI